MMPAPQRPGVAPLRTGVLLVEDDARIRQALGMALADAGYDIMEAATGEQALALLDSSKVDLIVLDVMLPGVDGLTICRTVRARSDLPIIIITARSDTSDVIEGLEAGADDYMTKPVVASELAARIRALLRRRRTQQFAVPMSSALIGDVEVSFDQGVARRGHQDVHLTKTEFRLLAELVTAAGRVVSREELLQQVWGYDYFGDTRLLDVHIRRLRRKVERDPDHPVLVLTVRGVGYRMGVAG